MGNGVTEFTKCDPIGGFTPRRDQSRVDELLSEILEVARVVDRESGKKLATSVHLLRTELQA